MRAYKTLMFNTIIGIQYDYKIIAVPFKGKYCFVIRAIHKETGRCSDITNTNIVLSDLNIDIDNLRFEETEWIINENEMNTFFSEIKKSLLDKNHLPYFESFLDQDRYEGEWENIDA